VIHAIFFFVFVSLYPDFVGRSDAAPVSGMQKSDSLQLQPGLTNAQSWCIMHKHQMRDICKPTYVQGFVTAVVWHVSCGNEYVASTPWLNIYHELLEMCAIKNNKIHFLSLGS